MYKEFERLTGEPKKALAFLSEVSFDAASRISSRIFIDEQNITIKSLPIGGEDGLESILSPFAKYPEHRLVGGSEVLSLRRDSAADEAWEKIPDRKVGELHLLYRLPKRVLI